MVNRPKAHVDGDAATAFLTAVFLDAGWTCETVRQDYGEDLHVRIFKNGVATNQFFWVQSKSTDCMSNYERSDGSFGYPFRVDHLKQWQSFRHPVIATLYDVNAKIAYWSDVHDALKEVAFNDQKQKILTVPEVQKIEANNVLKLQEHIGRRYYIFDEIDMAVSVITDALEEEYGIQLDFDPGGGLFWLPVGKFSQDSTKDWNARIYGQTAELFRRAAQLTGMNDGELFEETMKQIVANAKTLGRPK